MELTLGEETINTFKHAVERVSAIAHAKLPAELHGHLERATALVLHRHVWLGEDGRHAQVLSSDGQTWYRVNGACTCMDAPKAPQGYCKHKLAVMIYKRAAELLAASAGSASPPPAAAALPEAPASVNARVLIEGHDCQITLRDTDEERLLVRLAALLARYPAAACGGKGLPAAAVAASAQPTPEGWCLIHNLQMARQQNERGAWFSHKTPEGWCRGKAPRA